MEIQLICIGKTDDSELQKLISNYESRLKHYLKFSLQVIPDLKDAKNLSQEQQKAKEAAAPAESKTEVEQEGDAEEEAGE